MRSARISSAVALAALLAACGGGRRVPPPPMVPVDPPVLRIESFLPQAFDATGVTLALQGRIENPNPVALSVSGMTYAFEVEGQPAGSGQIPGRGSLPARGADPVTVPARFLWANVPNLLAVLVSRESLPVHVSGAVAVPGPSGVMELPYALDGVVVLPKLPAVAFRGASLRDAGVFKTVIEFRLQIHNPNPFPLPTGHLRYDLFLSGSPVAQAASYALATVPPGGTVDVAVPVSFSTIGAAAGAIQGAIAGRADVVLTGRAGYGPLEAAFDARAALTR
jgi:LEA14-like dessication related protein